MATKAGDVDRPDENKNQTSQNTELADLLRTMVVNRLDQVESRLTTQIYGID